jgi:hypothetical protein
MEIYLVNCSEYSTLPIFPGLQFPLLERIIIYAPLIVTHLGYYISSLPLLTPLLFSISSPRPSAIRLYLRLGFHILSGVELIGLDWSDLATFLVLPVFRHPIECVLTLGSASHADVVSSFEQNSDLKRLHETGKLVFTGDDFRGPEILVPLQYI